VKYVRSFVEFVLLDPNLLILAAALLVAWSAL